MGQQSGIFAHEHVADFVALDKNHLLLLLQTNVTRDSSQLAVRNKR